MTNPTSKFAIILLLASCVLSLNLRSGHLASQHDTLAHWLKAVEHAPSTTYSSYKASLDAIRDGIILSPPTALPTSSIPVTSFTRSECQLMTQAEKDQLSIQLVLIKNKLDALEAQLDLITINGSNYKTRLDVKN